MKILIGCIVSYVGFMIYNASLTTIKNQMRETGKREPYLVFILILGLILAVIGGGFIGYGLLPTQ